MVLYTDGLIERRGESLDEGMERLRGASVATPPRCRGLCRRLTRAMVEAESKMTSPSWPSADPKHRLSSRCCWCFTAMIRARRACLPTLCSRCTQCSRLDTRLITRATITAP